MQSGVKFCEWMSDQRLAFFLLIKLSDQEKK